MFAIVIGQVVFGLGTTLLGYLPSVGLDDILIVRMVSAVSGQFIGSASWVLGFIAAAWFLDRRYPSDMGLQITREWVGEFSVGFLLGIALQGAMLLIGLAAGWLTITGWLTGEVSLVLLFTLAIVNHNLRNYSLIEVFTIAGSYYQKVMLSKMITDY